MKQLTMVHQLQLYIGIDFITPAIWRRIIVNDNVSLRNLHDIIQCAMGWENLHLYTFSKKNYWFGNPELIEDIDMIDDATIELGSVLEKENDKLAYEYDFTDSWHHSVILEKIAHNKEPQTPICTGGERSCPPEGCGGIAGYMLLIDAMTKKQGDDYNEMKEWLGTDFDPEYFNIEEVNQCIQKIK
jgi:hypothetical protein